MPGAVEAAETFLGEVVRQRGLVGLEAEFVFGNVFASDRLAQKAPFDRIYCGASCPKPRLRDLLKLVRPGESASDVRILGVVSYP